MMGYQNKMNLTFDVIQRQNISTNKGIRKSTCSNKAWWSLVALD